MTVLFVGTSDPTFNPFQQEILLKLQYLTNVGTDDLLRLADFQYFLQPADYDKIVADNARYYEYQV
jgi:hypothetical protein